MTTLTAVNLDSLAVALAARASMAEWRRQRAAELLAAGKSRRQIARALGLGVDHVRRIVRAIAMPRTPWGTRAQRARLVDGVWLFWCSGCKEFHPGSRFGRTTGVCRFYSGRASLTRYYRRKERQCPKST